MRFLCILVVALLTFYITGCSAPGKGVRVWQEDKSTGQWYVGNAAIVGKKRIVTAYHVTDLHDEVSVNISRYKWINKWRTFKVRKSVNARHEPYVFLECEDVCFQDSYIFKIGIGKPHKVLTHRGTFLWKNYKPKKGDSGSPVVNIIEELIGVVYGYKIDNRKPLYIPVQKE